ncbi:MAG: TonB family protein [Bryobacteraceae bacterium]
MSASYWLGNLARWSMQAAVLTGAGALAAWIFGLRLPRVRLAYWQALLAVCLLLPAVEPWRNAADGDIEFTTGVALPIPARHAPSHALPWRETLLALLACGCAGRALWLAAGFGKLRRWRRDARPLAPAAARLDELHSGIAPRAELRLSAAVPGPVTFGLWRPVVLLPEQFVELPAEIQEAIVCHELLHVRRGDWIVTVAEQAVRAVLWFHPGVWWLLGQMQLAREQAVDCEVVARTGNRARYLDALLTMAGRRPVLDLAPAALFLRKRHLKSRVSLLLKEVSMSNRRIVSFCAASCGLLVAAGWLALHTFPLQAAPVPQEAAQSNLLHSVPPKYPEAARKKGIEGDVMLEVHIDAEGHVSDAKVLSGPEELRSAALEAILQWHYSPQAMTLPTVTQVTMAFKLPKTGAAEKPDNLPVLPPGKRVTIDSISVQGLTVSSDLLRQLPVHVGDMVDADGLRALATNVRAFDEHLGVSVSMKDEDSAAITIRVLPPDAASGGPSARIRVGGNVQQAKLVTKVTPVYPVAAKEQRIEGVVKLQAIIGKDGSVENLEVLSGDPLLAAAAMEAVRQWKYQTTLLNGDPVEVVTEVNVNFTLAK